MAAMPITAANTASTTRMPMTRTILSWEPNAEIAKFFTGGGVQVDGRTAHGHHAASPGPADPGDELADAQRDPAPVSRPATAPRQAARRVGHELSQWSIRSRTGARIAADRRGWPSQAGAATNEGHAR